MGKKHKHDKELPDVREEEVAEERRSKEKSKKRKRDQSPPLIDDVPNNLAPEPEENGSDRKKSKKHKKHRRRDDDEADAEEEDGHVIESRTSLEMIADAAGDARKEKRAKKDKERGERKEKKHKDRKEHKKHRSSGGGDDPSKFGGIPPEDEYSPPANSAAEGGGAEVSLSIEETNKLRAKLGLAPLRMEETTEKDVKNAETGQMERVVNVDGHEFVHRPAANLTDRKESEKLREKLQTQKDKRKLMEKISTTKTLGELSDDESDSAAAWVNRTRKLEEERRLAEMRAKLLDEMDNEFGITDILTDDAKKKQQKAKEYSAKSLAGLTVEHSKEAFVEGKEVILVLKDKDVLEEGEDVLINPVLLDEEQWKKNTELRKGKPGYNPYEEEVDAFGQAKKKNLLAKYDEELEGKKKDSFKIDNSGRVSLTREKELERIKMQLKNQAETLSQPSLQLATEYYTADEMAFKKPKKRVKKLRRREAVKADDLLPLAEDLKQDTDFGSRARGRGKQRDAYEAALTGKSQLQDMDVERRLPTDLDEPELLGPSDEEDLAKVVLEEDEAELELQRALAKQRRDTRLYGASASTSGAEKVVQLLSKLPKQEIKDEPMDDWQDLPSTGAAAAAPGPSSGGHITMDSVSEYCRGLGDIPTFGMAGNRLDTDFDESMTFDGEAKRRVERASSDEAEEMETAEGRRSPWRSRDHRGGSDNEEEEENAARSDDDVILDAEPDIRAGVATALKLATKKGYIGPETAKPVGVGSMKHLESRNYAIMDKQYQDIDDKYAKKLDRMGMGGPVVEFKEKRDYDPTIRIEYADEHGRLMDVKEAFQFQSWKFHGKKPGKNKLERNLKKRKEEQLLEQMSSTDTPLGTAALQQDKLRKLQVPYIVLSGSGARETGAILRKD